MIPAQEGAGAAVKAVEGTRDGKPAAQSDNESRQGKLRMAYGNQLPGRLSGADAETLSWHSPLFSEPAAIRHGAIRSLELDRPESIAPPLDPVAVQFRDGGRLYGDLVGFDEDFVTIQSRRCGRLRLDRAQVAELRWIGKGDLLWSGPTGEAGFVYTGAPSEARRWLATPRGELQTVGWKQRTTYGTDLPDKVEVEFRVTSSEAPKFEFQLLDDGQIINVISWDDEIVAKRGAGFLRALKLAPSDREVSLRVFWDQSDDSGVIALPDGTILGQWRSDSQRAGTRLNENGAPLVYLPVSNLEHAKSLPPDGVTISNRGRDLTLEALRIRRWDGSLPEKVRPPEHAGYPRLEIADGDSFGVFSGTIMSADGDAITVAPAGSPGGRKSIPLETVEAIVFDTVDLSPASKTEPADDSVDVTYTDGTRWRGTIEDFTDGALHMRTAYSSEPIKATVEGLLSLDFRRKTAEEYTEITAANADRLTVEKDTVLGTWVPAEGDRPQWKLPGALAPVPVADGRTNVDIRRAEAAENDSVSRPAALLHLQGGQSISGEFTTIGPDGEWLELRSALVENRRFPASMIRALQFTGLALETEGFRDRGWKPVRGKIGTNLEFEEPSDDDSNTGEKMVLKAGGAWGHGSMLQGNELRFTFQAREWGALRVRLFGPSVDSPDEQTTRLLFAHYGTEVYCGFETSPGDFGRQQDIAAQPGQPIPVRLTWDENGLEMFVKGQRAGAISFGDDFPHTGHALVFEPANLWGNGEREMMVWNFSLKTNPGVVATPAIDAEVRERALTIPRFRRDDPPRHALLAWTGDLLRGTVTAATDDRFSIRTGMESHQVDATRVAAAIWLQPPGADAGANGENDKPAIPRPRTENADGQPMPGVLQRREVILPQRQQQPPPDRAEGPVAGTLFPKGAEKADAAARPGRYTLLLRDGSRFPLDVESFGPEVVTGSAGKLGACHVPVSLVAEILSGEGRAADSGAVFANWQLRNAPEPTPAEDSGGESSPLVGKEAPTFELPVLGSEKPFKLEKGKVTVLDFWATWCGPCVRALPEMLEAFAGFDPAEVAFVGVNQAEAPEIIRPFLEQRRWPDFTVALDARQDVGRAYGVEGIPHTVIIDREGKVAWVATGFRPGGAEEAADKVRELLK